jgi:hypothetical protein
MKQIDTFEGFYDLNPGWEFDAPVFMMKPMFKYAEVGSTGYIDGMLEDYQIDVSVFGEAKPQYENFDMKIVWFDYIRAKFRLSRRFKYWKRVIEWNPDDMGYEKILKSIG